MARRALIGAALACGLLAPATLRAQPVEVAPFVGYQIGDTDSASSVGLLLDIPLWPGTQIEGLFSHQALGPNASIDHWQGGAVQEFDYGPVHPFLSGVLGVTRYAVEASNEFRFATGAGGGVKIFPVSHLGVRFDGRVYATFLDAEAVGGVCGGRGCLVGLHVDVAWQVEFTAAVVVRLGPAAARNVDHVK